MADSIAGKKTIDDWRKIRDSLPGAAATTWKTVFQDYFQTRLETRYLRPIRLIQQDSTFEGEGFAIVTIQCSLIEFLQSTVAGTSYRYLKRGETLGAYEYNRSRDVFIQFLTRQPPFSTYFIDAAHAEDFYANVRCGLLHEARTKGGWRIHAEDPTCQQQIVDLSQKILYRNDFHKALLTWIEHYGKRLETDTTYQEAFIRKYNALIT